MDERTMHDTLARVILHLVGEDATTVRLPVTVFVVLPSGAANTVRVNRDSEGFFYASDAPSLN